MDHRFSGHHPVASLHHNTNLIRRKIHIQPGAELHQPDPLARPDFLSGHQRIYYTTGHGSDNLFYQAAGPPALDEDLAVLVLFRGGVEIGEHFPAGMIGQVAHDAADGRAVDVYVKGAQKNTYAYGASAQVAQFRHLLHLPHHAVGAREHRVGVGGRDPLGVAEEKDGKSGQQDTCPRQTGRRAGEGERPGPRRRRPEDPQRGQDENRAFPRYPHVPKNPFSRNRGPAGGRPPARSYSPRSKAQPRKGGRKGWGVKQVRPGDGRLRVRRDH